MSRKFKIMSHKFKIEKKKKIKPLWPISTAKLPAQLHAYFATKQSSAEQNNVVLYCAMQCCAAKQSSAKASPSILNYFKIDFLKVIYHT